LIRSTAKAALAALLALVLWPAEAPAQTPSEAPKPAAVNPRGPIPYTVYKKAIAPKPKPKPVAHAAGAASAAGPVTPTGVTPPLPVTATGSRLLPGEAAPPAELESFVDGVVKEAMDRDHIAGVTVSVVQNGQIVFKKGYGFADLAPRRRVDPDKTLFRIGSISKTFTWIALMKEVEAGRIRINAPINLYLPERQQVKDQGYRTPVRVENLLDHSAGFEDRALGQLFERKFSRERPLTEYIRQERPHRVSEPGAISSYSNYGAALAGLAVTYVSGKPFERAMEDEIIVPLGLRHTTFREPHPVKTGLPAPMPARLVPDISQGYRSTAAGFQLRPYEYIGHIGPAGAASSTAGDMARYMLMLLGNGTLEQTTIFGAKTAAAFRTPLRKTAPGVNGWAHGFMVYDLPGGHRGYGHPGATLSFRSNLVVTPDLGLGVFVGANTESGAQLVNGLPARIVQQFYAPPRPFPVAGSPELAASRALYKGHYVGDRRAYGGLEGFAGLLTGGTDVDVTPDGRLLLKSFGKAQAFGVEGEPRAGRFVSADGVDRLAFSFRDGRAVAFQTAAGDNLFERTGFWFRPITLLTFAILTAVAAAATLAGVVLRNRREFRENSIQNRASMIQNSQAVLWLAALGLFVVWAMDAGDPAAMVYGWPGPFLVFGSACALVASFLTLATLIFTPAVWRGGRRVDSWSAWRKIFFTTTVLVYTGFTVLLGLWGAIWPWSG